MLETSLLSIRIKVLIFYVIYLFVFVLWHYTQQEDFFDYFFFYYFLFFYFLFFYFFLIIFFLIIFYFFIFYFFIFF